MEQHFIFDTNNVGRSTATTRKQAYAKAYDKWAKHMIFDQKYNIGVRFLKNKFYFSDYWVRARLRDKLNYVKITPSKLKELGLDSHSTLLFRERDIRKYFKEIAIFTRQTIVTENKAGIKYSEVNQRKRSECPEVQTESFDFWNCALKVSSDYTNRETAYREFFNKGYVKIALFGKSLFVLKEDIDKINNPITVAYKDYIELKNKTV